MRIQYSETNTFPAWISNDLEVFVIGPPGFLAREPPAPKAQDLLTMFPRESINWEHSPDIIILYWISKRIIWKLFRILGV